MFVSQEVEEGSNKASRGRDLWGEVRWRNLKRAPTTASRNAVLVLASSELCGVAAYPHISEPCIGSSPDLEWSGVAMKNREQKRENILSWGW